MDGWIDLTTTPSSSTRQQAAEQLHLTLPLAQRPPQPRSTGTEPGHLQLEDPAVPVGVVLPVRIAPDRPDEPLPQRGALADLRVHFCEAGARLADEVGCAVEPVREVVDLESRRRGSGRHFCLRWFEVVGLAGWGFVVVL